MQNIIVQAGGLGSRLESLTINKPKCMVSIDNLPIIFHLFKKFPKARFSIIADYKHDILEKYLTIFAKDIDFRIIKASEKGTCSGIADAAADIDNKLPLILIWCDLVLGNEFFLPQTTDNYIAISNTFECRWSFKNNQLIKEPSKENGVAGLFFFKEAEALKEVPKGGEFVAWLATQNINFQRFDLTDSKEIGTMMSFYQNSNKGAKCRPFNKIECCGDYVEKSAVNEYGAKIAVREKNWYKFVTNLNYKHIPQIQTFEPLVMQRIRGKNIYEYQNFTLTQKQGIIKKIVGVIKELHELQPTKPASEADLIDNYITKTFDRIETVKDLIPFANDREIEINGKKYQNVFHQKESLINEIKKFFPKNFYVIHGDTTFSNIMLDDEKIDPLLIDPRGYFGNTEIYGDKDYDFAKLYYSIIGNYDQFNNKNFSLEIGQSGVSLKVVSNNWEDVAEFFIKESGVDIKKIKLLHAIIWLSFCTYAWDDYDSICASFYNGLIYLNEAL